MDRHRDGGRLSGRDAASRVGRLLNPDPSDPSPERLGGTSTLAPARPNVLFVVGSGRSGSTLLDILLGQIPGFFSTGELHSLWWAGIRRWFITALTLPLLIRHGYPIWHRAMTREAA
jgi:hypothetical protein